MKKLLIAALTLVSVSAFAETPISKDMLPQYIEAVSEGIKNMSCKIEVTGERDYLSDFIPALKVASSGTVSNPEAPSVITLVSQVTLAPKGPYSYEAVPSNVERWVFKFMIKVEAVEELRIQYQTLERKNYGTILKPNYKSVWQDAGFERRCKKDDTL